MFKWLYFEHTENKLKRMLGAKIPKTAEELELDKKRKKNEQYWVMDIHSDPSFSNVPGNEYHKY